jgi:hypothetical protein
VVASSARSSRTGLETDPAVVADPYTADLAWLSYLFRLLPILPENGANPLYRLPSDMREWIQRLK